MRLLKIAVILLIVAGVGYAWHTQSDPAPVDGEPLENPNADPVNIPFSAETEMYDGGYFVLDHYPEWGLVEDDSGKLLEMYAPEYGGAVVIALTHSSGDAMGEECDIALRSGSKYLEEQIVEYEGSVSVSEHYALDDQERVQTAKVIWAENECVIIEPVEPFAQDESVKQTITSVRLKK